MNLAHNGGGLREATWRTSSRSANNSYCVEVALTSEVVGVRDTKARDGGTLVFNRQQWTSFLAGLKSS